jgi:hypothetical protein
MVKIRLFLCSCLMALCLILAVPSILHAQTQAPAQNTEQSDLRPLAQADSLLSVQGAQRLMAEANSAIGSEQYDVAVSKLQEARKVFNQLSNFHLQLANSFSGIDTTIYEAQRTKALQSGQMRDETTYQLALVHRAQNKPELSVPLLVQVIRSQNPTSELGKKSYQQLYELGFVELAFTPSSRTMPQNQQQEQEEQPENPQPQQQQQGNPQGN